MTTGEEPLKVAHDAVNSYEQTVNAILSFAAFIVHDGNNKRPDSEFGIGRRMTTSKENPIASNIDITPDIVAQKSGKYGVVAEVKRSLSKNQKTWVKHIRRLRKYDDRLKGWWIEKERIPHSDTIFLIHQSHERLFTRFLEAKKESEPELVGPNTCVVQFNYSEERVTYIFFRLEFGNLHDLKLNQRLDEGVSIPLDDVRISFPIIHFYDAPPPMPWLLLRLWTDLFPAMIEGGEWDEKTQSTKIKVSIPEITDELQKAFGSKALRHDHRSGEFPKKRWVREALERLIKYKFATPSDSEDGNYIIYYKFFKKGDVLERFIKLELGKSDVRQTEDERQLKMFPDLVDE